MLMPVIDWQEEELGGASMRSRIIYSFTEPIIAEDLHGLLQQTDWADGRSPLDIQQLLDKSQITLGAWDEDRLIAFLRVITDDCYRALIDDVVVDAAYRGRGIASQMLQRALARTQHIEQIMLDCDAELCGFYAKSGFELKECAAMILTNPRPVGN